TRARPLRPARAPRRRGPGPARPLRLSRTRSRSGPGSRVCWPCPAAGRPALLALDGQRRGLLGDSVLRPRFLGRARARLTGGAGAVRGPGPGAVGPGLRRGAEPYLPLTVSVPASSVTAYSGSGSSAGPESTSPVVTEKCEEWHGQMMASSVTLLT